MNLFKRAILTHGGSASDPKDSDGTHSAAKIGMDLLVNGKSPLDAVASAVRYLEDDPRFNAGKGSNIRIDGSTMQLDASCMSSNGEFGAVACVEGIQNPIDIAKGVLLHSPYILIAGDGANIFADEQNIALLPQAKLTDNNSFQKPKSHTCDTVGAVAFDGKTFAAALSSGGIKNSALGRVGDVPLPGCGLYCGPIGAIACTGDGEYIALKILAKEVYDLLGQCISPEEAVIKAINMFNVSVDIGIIVLTKDAFASKARNKMAWSSIVEKE